MPLLGVRELSPRSLEFTLKPLGTRLSLAHTYGHVEVGIASILPRACCPLLAHGS